MDYIKAITDGVEQRLLHELPDSQKWMQDVMINGNTVQKKAAITWDGEDLVLDNSRTLLQDYHMEYPSIRISLRL